MNPVVSPRSFARLTRSIAQGRDQRRLASLANLGFRSCRLRAQWRIGIRASYAVMRSLMRLGSLSRRLAATISKSFHDVCVNAPQPLQSALARYPRAWCAAGRPRCLWIGNYILIIKTCAVVLL